MRIVGGACEADGATNWSRVQCVNPREASNLWHRHTANQWNLAYLLYTDFEGYRAEKKNTLQPQARKNNNTQTQRPDLKRMAVKRPWAPAMG